MWQTVIMAHAEDSPSVRLGDDAMDALLKAGWMLKPDGGSELTSDIFEPELVGEDMLFEGEDSLTGYEGSEGYESGQSQGEGEGGRSWTKGDSDPDSEWDESEDAEEQMWRRLVKRHQRAAVDGDEPGGMVTGKHLEMERSLLREAVPLAEYYSAGKLKPLASGPQYTTPEDNPPQYKGKEVRFIPEFVHTKVKEWVEMEPAVDSEVLRIIQHKIHVRVPEAATGLHMENGKNARENPDDLLKLMQKRLRNKSFRGADPDKLVNVLSLNLQPKPTADPPWRLTFNPGEVNAEDEKWSVQYEGAHKLPLVLTEGCWMLAIDLESGYDALGFDEESKPLFGSRMLVTEAQATELLQEGLVERQHVKKAAGGKRWVYV